MKKNFRHLQYFLLEMAKPADVAFISLFLFLTLIFTSAYSQKKIEKNLSERRQALLEYLVEKESTPSFAAVAARYATGERIAEANRMFSELLQQPSGEATYGFYLMATYLFGQNSMPDSLRAKVQHFFSTHVLGRGYGECTRLVYYVTIFLAAQTWPTMPAEQWFNGKSSRDNWQEARAYIENWMETTVTQGQTQFDSPELLPLFVAPLELLQEFAIDDHPFARANGNAAFSNNGSTVAVNLRNRAGMMLDLLLIDFAEEHIDGMYAGAHSHDPEPGVYSPRQSASTALAWLYFGAGEMRATTEALFSALSSYSVPEAIFELAMNRDPLGGYAHRERKRVRNFIRTSNDRHPAVYKYAYTTRYYVLGSLQGGLLHPMQQHSWDLTYLAPKDRHPTMFVMHPYFNTRDLGSFFIDEPALLLDELNKARKWYLQPEKLASASPYEHIFQHRNVLIALYAIPEEIIFGHLNGFFSEDLEEWDSSLSDGRQHPPDWIFCHAGNTFVALRPLQPFRFEKMDGGYRFVSEGRRNGVILEVSTPEESQTLDEFKRRIREISKLEVREADKQFKVKYTTTYGDQMEIVHDASSGTVERYFDDFPYRFTDWPLFENPFIKFDEAKRQLTLHVKKQWRVLDFKNWKISEQEGSFTDELGK